MTARLLFRPSILAIASVVAVAALATLGELYLDSEKSAPSKQAVDVPQISARAGLRPSLDCAFHDMMRTRAIVSFYFDVVVRNGEGPRFFERAIVSEDGIRVDYTGNDRPAWAYGFDEDGRQTITSPDSATRIVLYGLKLGVSGVLPVEAGIRSNEYRNLGGECRQTNLRPQQSAKAEP